MPKRRTRWSRVIRVLIGVAAVGLAVVIVWALLVPGTDWLARHDIGSTKGSLAAARDAARGRLLTLGAGLLAAGALLFTARNFVLSREGQVTDRYTKAIEQLGSDKLDVRIGGIYALERIARDSAKDHPTVMEVLTAFIRAHSREPWPPSDTGNPEQQRFTRPDVQAAVTVVGRRDAKRDIQPIDLAGADLGGADLTRADLTGATLRSADLARADFLRANLTHANLTHANLTRADLTGANLTDALLVDANLTDATLARANLTYADLTDATLVRTNLTRADLTYATLDSADLTEAKLTDADLTYATLYGASLADANLRNARLADANLADANLTDALLVDADLTRADLARATLDGVRLNRATLTDAKLIDANLTRADLSDIRWPEGVPAPEGWMVDDESGRLERAGGLSEVTAH